MPHRLTLAVLVLLLGAGCVTTQTRVRSNALEFLYPKGANAVAPGDVTLRLPVRVGVAFAPPSASWADRFTANQKQALLKRVADAFTGKSGIAGVEVISPGFLTPTGGFVDLDRLRTAFGIDLIALISYDQAQFRDSGRSSWAYWTIVGLYVVKGEKNDTQTFMEAVVYDIQARALLFNASGQSAIGGKSTPIDAGKILRDRSGQGFETATDDLITNLNTALQAFQAQAATGTVRGPGTPAIAMLDESGKPVGGTEAQGGAALGIIELLGAVSLAGMGVMTRRRTQVRREGR
ncbi:MAG TPA: rhombotarget lipoprotein [Candidatus Polarisedimenticolia bacterium]|nr:rhombotarget lipoprotein [Candidatus Polarisedimenticolia bacterium]